MSPLARVFSESVVAPIRERGNSAGVPEEFIRLANDKLAAINAAYDRIEAERGKL